MIERKGRYSQGRQPCDRFRARDDLTTGGGNVHECFGPYDGRARSCKSTVSFCANCSTDHHAGGWDTCGA
jgi:hypothetical protein